MVFLVGNNVEEVVDSVAEIDISHASFGKHDFGAFGSAVQMCVTGFVGRSTIGFGFGNDACCLDAVKVGTECFAE